jgi:hypothetical protein
MSDSALISSYLLFALTLVAFLPFVIWRLRQLNFFKNNNLPSFIKCALLWAMIVACVCLGFALLAIDFELIFSDMNKDGSLTKGALNLDEELIYPVPLAAIFGAAFGALFSTRRYNASASALKRGLVGAGIGLVVTLLLAILMAGNALNFNFDDHYSTGMWMMYVMITSALIPILALLALLTPKHCLGKNEKL